MEDRPFPSAPDVREPATEPKDPLSMEQVREIHARSKDNAELEASWEAEQARRAQAASPETAERTDGPPDAAADKSSDQDRPDVLQGPDEPQPVQAEASTRNSEGTQASEEPPSPDKPAAMDKDAERVEELETELAETKGELAEAKSELFEERADRRKLTSVVADQAEEIKRLRAQLEAKDAKTDQPAADDDAVDSSPKTVASQDKPLSEPDRPWYKKVPLPSEKAAGLFTGAAGLVESVGVATHGMSGTTESIVGAAIGFGVAGIGYARERRKEKAEKEKETNG